jgi:Tfp pilus assembly protein PilW
MMNRVKRTTNNQQGYTLIELSLAMVFLSFIMIFIVVVLFQLLNTYNKGVALSSITSIGRQVNRDFSGSSRYGGGSTGVVLQGTAGKAVAELATVAGGRLCVNGVSYVWNVGSADARPNKFAGGDGKDLNLIRVTDNTGSYCNPDSNGTYPVPTKSGTGVTDLTSAGVWVMASEITHTAPLTRWKFTLATSGGNAPIVDNGNFKCLANRFCAFTNFNIVIYQRSS